MAYFIINHGRFLVNIHLKFLFFYYGFNERGMYKKFSLKVSNGNKFGRSRRMWKISNKVDVKGHNL